MGRRILQRMENVQKPTRRDLKIVIFCFISLIVFYTFLTAFNKLGYIVNISKSLPLGIYKTERIKGNLKLGDTVFFVPNEDKMKFIRERKYIANEKLIKGLLKKIGGLPGDYFTVIKEDMGMVLIKNNKEKLGLVMEKDSKNRELPHIYNLQLEKGEFFLLGESLKSYDSRYFGKVYENEIKFKVKPILTF